MIRIVKDGMTFECDSEAELRLALGVLAETKERPMVATFTQPLTIIHPSTVLPPIGSGSLGETTDAASTLPDGFYRDGNDAAKRASLELVKSESPDSVGTQHISVHRAKLDVLEAVMLFPEGVATNSIAQLLGITDKAACNRIQSLKRAGLVQKVDGHWLWTATQLARRSKLVAC